MKGKREPLAVRFWQFVNKTSDHWLWTGATGGDYGRLGDGTGSGYRYAHHVSYELNVGPIGEGQWVLHKCDTPLCVNPAHLYLGDRSRNMKDAYERGRIDLATVRAARHQR